MDTSTNSSFKSAEQQQQQQTSQPKITDVEITDKTVALNVMVSFLNIAQKRGVFFIDESSKIFECIKKFQE